MRVTHSHSIGQSGAKTKMTLIFAPIALLSCVGHYKLPADRSLLISVLMVILWRQVMTGSRRHLVSTTHAPIHSGVRSECCGSMDTIERLIVDLL